MVYRKRHTIDFNINNNEDNASFLANDLSQLLTQEGKGWALVLLGPAALSPGISRGLDSRKHSSWLGLPTLSPTNSDKLLQEYPITQERRVLKRERRNLFQVLATGGGGNASLNNPALCPQSGHLEFSRERFKEVRAREQAAGRECMITAADRYVVSTWSWAGKGTCGVWSSRHSLPISAFLAWQLECPGHCTTPSLLPQESVVRNKHNGY